MFLTVKGKRTEEDDELARERNLFPSPSPNQRSPFIRGSSKGGGPGFVRIWTEGEDPESGPRDDTFTVCPVKNRKEKIFL